jgi:hypothetical protein
MEQLMKRHEILFEGMSQDEILQLPSRDLDHLILLGDSIVFRAGSASILGSFKIEQNCLTLEPAQIDGGGEGILVALGTLARRLAKMRELTEVEWIVHAVSCSKPNIKLRRVLEKRGFEMKNMSGIGTVYRLLESIAPTRSPEWSN